MRGLLFRCAYVIAAPCLQRQIKGADEPVGPQHFIGDIAPAKRHTAPGLRRLEDHRIAVEPDPPAHRLAGNPLLRQPDLPVHRAPDIAAPFKMQKRLIQQVSGAEQAG